MKILDLGLAVLRSEEKRGSGLTEQGQILGTLDYMAPEQWEDSRAVDIRADIYSPGCSFYHLLAGKPPFGSEEHSSLMKQMWAHALAPLPPLRELRPDVPEHIAALLDRMLAKKPADRFGTPAEVAAALATQAAVISEDTSSTIRSLPSAPATVLGQPRKRSLRRLGVGAGLAALLLLAAASALFLFRGGRGAATAGQALKVGVLHSRTRALYSDDETQASRQAEQWCRLLNEEGGATTLAVLRQWEWPARKSSAWRAAWQALESYFARHRHRMEYPEYVAEGWQTQRWALTS